MIHYVKTKKPIILDNTLDNILYVGDLDNDIISMISSGYFQNLHTGIHEYGLWEYIIDLECEFEQYNKKDIIGELYQFCSNIRQFKINELTK